MATKRAGDKPGAAAPTVRPAPELLSREDVLALVQAGVDRSLAAVQDSTKTVAQSLDALRGEVATTVLTDAMALIAEADAPERTELQRRARAIQIELTLRRQEVALEEWRRKTAAAGEEAERQRQLFARLEADFERRAADGERAARAAEATAAALQRTVTERDAALAVLVETHGALNEARTQAELQARELADRNAELARARDADQLATQQAERERERLQECERQLAELSAGRESDRLALRTLQGTLDQCRQEKDDLAERLGQAQAELAAGATELTEAYRRVEELRSSRWRQLGIGLGLARRATFEK